MACASFPTIKQAACCGPEHHHVCVLQLLIIVQLGTLLCIIDIHYLPCMPTSPKRQSQSKYRVSLCHITEEPEQLTDVIHHKRVCWYGFLCEHSPPDILTDELEPAHPGHIRSSCQALQESSRVGGAFALL